jgi:hypothetical protein
MTSSELVEQALSIAMSDADAQADQADAVPAEADLPSPPPVVAA